MEQEIYLPDSTLWIKAEEVPRFKVLGYGVNRYENGNNCYKGMAYVFPRKK